VISAPLLLIKVLDGTFTSSKAYCITANISLNYSILPDNMGIDQKPKEETSNRQTDNRAYRLKKFIHKTDYTF